MAEFDLTLEDLNIFLSKTRVVILTPKSKKGIPLAISSLPPPPINYDDLMRNKPEEILEMIDSIAKTLLMRAYPSMDLSRLQTQEKLLVEIIAHAWRMGEKIEGLEGLGKIIKYLQDPPISKIGFMDLDDFIPKKDRTKLAQGLNTLAIGSEKLWLDGEKLDLDYLIEKYSKDGKTPIFVVNMSDLNNFEDQMFVVSSISYYIYKWMKEKGGAGEPRLLYYIDEIGGGGGKQAFFPSHPYYPPSKAPLMMLIKQARSFGVCCVFATQNPGDIDYKSLSNCGTWLIGKLQTKRDREKVFQGLSDAEVLSMNMDINYLDSVLSSLNTGEFFLKRKDGRIDFFKERWIYSYHKTLSPDEIAKIVEFQREIEKISHELEQVFKEDQAEMDFEDIEKTIDAESSTLTSETEPSSSEFSDALKQDFESLEETSTPEEDKVESLPEETLKTPPEVPTVVEEAVESPEETDKGEMDAASTSSEPTGPETMQDDGLITVKIPWKTDGSQIQLTKTEYKALKNLERIRELFLKGKIDTLVSLPGSLVKKYKILYYLEQIQDIIEETSYLIDSEKDIVRDQASIVNKNAKALEAILRSKLNELKDPLDNFIQELNDKIDKIENKDEIKDEITTLVTRALELLDNWLKQLEVAKAMINDALNMNKKIKILTSDLETLLQYNKGVYEVMMESLEKKKKVIKNYMLS